MSLDKLPRIRISCRGREVDADIAMASTFWSRLKGLAWAAAPPGKWGLLIDPCSSIHMVGMYYPLEIIFLSKDNTVLKICKNIRPWSGFCFCPGARSALEWLPGNAASYGIRVGDSLELENLAPCGSKGSKP